MPVLLHGDAAFAGQGVVYETMQVRRGRAAARASVTLDCLRVAQMAKLPGFNVGGTIHIVCNNQIGYTTNTTSSRSTEHASDLGRAFEAPVIHVNADDVPSESARARVHCVCVCVPRSNVGLRTRQASSVRLSWLRSGGRRGRATSSLTLSGARLACVRPPARYLSVTCWNVRV